jgi:hypothetical protein
VEHHFYMTTITSPVFAQVSTERKTPRKAGDSVMFMEQLVIPYHNLKKDVLKVCMTL